MAVITIYIIIIITTIVTGLNFFLVFFDERLNPATKRRRRFLRRPSPSQLWMQVWVYREGSDHSCFIVADAAGVYTLPKILYIIIQRIYIYIYIWPLTEFSESTSKTH